MVALAVVLGQHRPAPRFVILWSVTAAQVSYSPDGNLLIARPNGAGWVYIDTTTGKPDTSNPEKRKWMQFGTELLEVVYQSRTETLASGGGGLIAFDGDGNVKASGKGGGGWAMTLVGNPERGPFAFRYSEGGPYNDRVQIAEVVLQDLRAINVDYYNCYDAGPYGALVSGSKPTPDKEFNVSDGVLQCLDPISGKPRWKIRDTGNARFWGRSVLAWPTGENVDIFDAKTGKRRPRHLKLPKNDELLDVIDGDLLVERREGELTVLERLHLESGR